MFSWAPTCCSEADAAFLVGVYAEGVTSDYLIEDFKFVVDQIAGRESKYENISARFGE